MTAQLEHLISITGPNFVAGLVAVDGKVVKAAPIIAFMIGWNGAHVARYCRAKGWRWERVKEQEQSDGAQPTGNESRDPAGAADA